MAEPDRRLDYIFSDANLAVIDAGPFKDHRYRGWTTIRWWAICISFASD